ncbi:uncharacterized protein LOC134206284 isoform X1 [Armigeres subalbatus]|uniref:uncharacterized protein LOC134206284 isoform X1 n=1 Tax=Armigeres subalbatus TaxID=124917 RepID=UPI002ED393F8
MRQPSRLLSIWIQEFLSNVASRRPAFIALHLQEVGGKTYDKSMEYVQEFIKNLCESAELADYNRIRVYLDEDYNSAEHFTALGNLYFAIRTIDSLQMWNFLTHEWESVEGKNIHTGNIESVASKEKAKFPQQFFPECKWSRKGFLRTRWSLNGTVFDLVNIHLFHDASNLAACEEYPSVYCKSRRRALVHTLERFHQDSVNQTVPYFVFGDFNFRCDTEGVIKKLTEDLTMHRVPNPKNDSTKVQYRDSDGSNVLTVGKKEFNHHNQSTFKESWLRQYDRELDSLRSILHEYPITFPPSYPYEEDPGQPGSYMSTRCPAWCDRILISPAARKIIDEREHCKTGGMPAATTTPTMAKSTYGIMGEVVCMGDHKPVFLHLRIKTSQGILNYCSCDTHVHRRVEHNSNSSNNNVNVNHNNNSCSSFLASKLNSNSSNANDATSIISNSIGFPSVPTAAHPDNSNHSPPSTALTSTAQSTLTSPTFANHQHHCPVCFDRIQSTFDRILSELEIPTGLCATGADSDEKKPQDTSRPAKLPPPVRISVFDTDSNANVCMCSMYSSSFSLVGGEYRRSRSGSTSCLDQSQVDTGGGSGGGGGGGLGNSQICPNCRNIIKHQPMEHRKTLISRRLMLANDIIVNRIDTHYLNTYTTTGGGITATAASANRQFEPYTPESVESHSPAPESADNKPDFDESQPANALDAIDSPTRATDGNPKQPLSEPKQPNASLTNSSSKKSSTIGGGVSPRQLKSRLEKLKRISDRRKTYQETKALAAAAATGNNSAVLGEELQPLDDGRGETGPGGKSSHDGGVDEVIFVGSDGQPRRHLLLDADRNDGKLAECCHRRWNCCAIA